MIDPINPNGCANGILLLAQHYLLIGELAEAQKYAYLLLTMKKDVRGRALIILAEVAVRHNRKAVALDLCYKALNYNPNSPNIHMNICSLIIATDLGKALEHLKYAITLNPFILDSIIYAKGESPNIFIQQSSFLSCTKVLLNQLGKYTRCTLKNDRNNTYENIMGLFLRCNFNNHKQDHIKQKL